MQAHDVKRGIVQNQIDVVERHNARQPVGEIIEQLDQVPVNGDRFRNLQKSTVLIAREKRFVFLQQHGHRAEPPRTLTATCPPQVEPDDTAPFYSTRHLGWYLWRSIRVS